MYNEQMDSFSKAHPLDFKVEDHETVMFLQPWGEWKLMITEWNGSYKITCSNDTYTDEWVSEDPDLDQYDNSTLWEMAWSHFDKGLVDAEELHQPSNVF